MWKPIQINAWEDREEIVYLGIPDERRPPDMEDCGKNVFKDKLGKDIGYWEITPD